MRDVEKIICKIKEMTDQQFFYYYNDTMYAPILKHCYPIVNSFPFQRLKNCTFLGILSSKFNFIEITSLTNNKSKIYNVRITDQTRFEHSISVAYLSYLISEILNFDTINKKYAIAWGLLHDISSWPLSHTGEAAFKKITKISSSKLREMIITGSQKLPERYNIKRILEKLGLSIDKLLSLFDKKNFSFFESELNHFWNIIHSPLTPDTLDGVWRAGKNFGMVNIPKPLNIIMSINPVKSDLIDIFVDNEYIDLIKFFWKKKNYLYKNFINDNEIIHWESACSMFIKNNYNDLTLTECLELPEERLIKNLKNYINLKSKIILRYKNPFDYQFNGFNKINESIPLNYLNDMLIKTRIRKIYGK